MGNVIDESKGQYMTREMHGRRVIYADVPYVNEENVGLVLQTALNTHSLNQSEIDYLWNYYKGKQPILYRVNSSREELTAHIVENRAHEIVDFKVGYLCGEPIQYVGRDESATEYISLLNDWMFGEDKANQDQELVKWQMICGTAYRMVLPDEMSIEEDDAPFEMYTLDPRTTFVVYSPEFGNRPLMAVSYYVDTDKMPIYSIYTDNWFYRFQDGLMIESKPHALGMIPIFEYPANLERMGAFEIVLALLDMLNDIDSGRMEAVEQTVQAFLKFINCDIDADGLQALKQLGAIKVKSLEPGTPADVDVVKTDLNQSQTQTLKDDIYQSILTICGMPNRNGGLSTSDTGTAVIFRDGWQAAQADPQNYQRSTAYQAVRHRHGVHKTEL